MQQAETAFEYTISGLRVRSAVELPSAIAASSSTAPPDVTIAMGSVPEVLSAPEKEGPGWQMQGARFLFHAPGVLRALIEEGRLLTVETFATTDPGDLQLFLLGTCFAIALQQRGRLVVHASAVAVDGKAILFCGGSGAGKSTVAAMLVRRGYPLLNDDVCNLSLGEDGRYEVHPDGRMLKLWSGSIHHLQAEADEAYRIRHDHAKFYFAPDRVDLAPRPVGGVYLLQANATGQAAEVTACGLAEATQELMVNVYRPALVQAMSMVGAYFAAFAAMQRAGGVYRFTRPMDFACAEASLDVLEQHWQSLRGA